MNFRTKVLLVLLSIILLTTSCGKKQEAEEEVIRPVRYQQVYATGGTRTRTFSGAAKSGLESNLSFKLGGTISRINVKVGDNVNTGQLIAQLDSKDFQLQVQQAEAALEQAKAQALNAKANYDRTRSLYENNNASKSELDRTRAAYESANASVSSAEKQLELARSQVGYTRLTAPFTGVISAVNVEVNENVNAGTPIVTLTGEAKPEVELSVPEMLITQIKEGKEVTITFDAIPDKVFTGIISEVGIATSQYSTTYPVTVQLKDTDPDIRPGMVADVEIKFESSKDKELLIVPSHAVMEDEKGRFVYVAEPLDDTYATTKRVEVKIGDITTEGLEITEGLIDGELVITAGVSRIKEGMKVKLLAGKE
jgi:RND family efflux transporter MFP subunit